MTLTPEEITVSRCVASQLLKAKR